jgi:polyisoprenyl-teichoic acid--peptidoglycan teichoic acid transferase
MINPIDTPGSKVIPPKITSTSGRQASLLAQPKNKRSHRGLKITLGLIVLTVFLLSGYVVSRAVNLTDKIFVGKKTTFIGKIFDVFKGNSGDTKIVGEDLGQINILLLGIGGEGHDGPYLSDTIILAQIRPDTGQAVLTSIPRDYLVNLPYNLGQRKINAAFAEGFARNQDWDEAGRWSRELVEKMSGLSIPYFAVIDFSGFKKAVDQVGGVDIQIERTFTDYTFPNDKTKGYLPAITFEEGMEHMDGTRALIYARSRHAAGPEGSDFARSVRQQKVISTLKKKVLELNLITDVGTINKLADVFADHFHTNLSPGEAFRLYKLMEEHNINTFHSLSLDPETGLVCDGRIEENGAYVITPCAGKTNADVQNFFKNAFTMGAITSEQPVIWLANSTDRAKAYQEADKKLKDGGITVWELPYGGVALDQNTYYIVNNKPATEELIKNTFQASRSFVAPKGVNVNQNKVDIVLILGGALKDSEE